MPLLATKLYIPPIRPELVSRSRLIERLNAGLCNKLTLVSAPAGFGKTTLLSKWVRCRDQTPPPHPVAWLSLDEGDNDPARFLAYLVAALQRIDTLHAAMEPAGRRAMDALRSPRFGQANASLAIEEILTTLVNQIDALSEGSRVHSDGGAGTCLVLVFDDYHMINAQAVHDAVTFLLDHLPAQMHLVIATRTDPPLPIARLRGQGQVMELRQADLSFTVEEAAQFLNEVMDLELSVGEVAALSARTEGWIAGLQMASIALQARLAQSRLTQSGSAEALLAEPGSAHAGQRPPPVPQPRGDDIASFVRTFAGSDRFIMDYLVEEVLGRQPESIQAFLLQTAILDRLGGPLCDAVITCRQIGKLTGEQSPPPTTLADLPFSRSSGQEILEYLERTNLFVVPLDDRREWYRYHHLFGDLLRQRLCQVRPDLVPILHHRASKWYERNGLTSGAIEHALSAGEYERAAHLIELAAEITWKQSEIATFLTWVEALPRDIVQVHPMLGVYHAIGLLMSGHPLHVIESRLQGMAPPDAAHPDAAHPDVAHQDAEHQVMDFSPQDGAGGHITGSVSGGMAVYQAMVAAYQGKTEQAAELSREALELLPEENLFLRSLVMGTLGLTLMYSGDVSAATRALKEAAHVSQQVGNLMNAVLALCHLAELGVFQGRLHEAWGHYTKALALAVDREGRPLPVAGIALIGLGQLLLEWNDLDAAGRYLQEGTRLTSRWGGAGTLRGYSALALVRQAQGDLQGAQDLLQRAEEIAIRFDAMEVDDISVARQQAELSIAAGNLHGAWLWAEARGLKQDAGLAELDIKACRDSFIHGYSREMEYATLARLLIAQALASPKRSPARNDEAPSRLLERLCHMAERQGHSWQLIELLVIQAVALRVRGDTANAMRSLERALHLAEPENIVRVFVAEGDRLGGLLRQAAAGSIEPAYARKLLGEFETAASGPVAVERPPPCPATLIEPLSKREVEVLRLLTTHLSSTEIADHLVISVNTVRSHIKNIYGKLDVHARADAVQLGQELNLV